MLILVMRYTCAVTTSFGSVHRGSSSWFGGPQHGLLHQQRDKRAPVRRWRNTPRFLQGWSRWRSVVTRRCWLFQSSRRRARPSRPQERPKRDLGRYRFQSSIQGDWWRRWGQIQSWHVASHIFWGGRVQEKFVRQRTHLEQLLTLLCVYRK